MSIIKASIDLGSNTFQLLITEIHKNHPLEILVEESFTVKLFFDQNQKNKIADLAVQRAFNALEHIQQICKKFQIEAIHVAATSALRDAENGNDLAQVLFQKIKNIAAKKHHLQVITGQLEAEYITKAQFYWLRKQIKSPYIIIDIGGGSVEFAFMNLDQKLELSSLPLGVARLIHDFQISFQKALTPSLLTPLKSHIKNELLFLKSAFATKQNIQLLGVSGAFETNATLLNLDISKKFSQYSSSDFLEMHYDLLYSSPQQRSKNEKIPKIRKDMILIANLIIECLIEEIRIDEILYSGFDLKYGLLLKDDIN